MTLDEAIEILEKPFPRPNTRKKGTYSQAVNLAIEALKRIKDVRTGKRLSAQPLLPGETKQ